MQRRNAVILLLAVTAAAVAVATWPPAPPVAPVDPEPAVVEPAAPGVGAGADAPADDGLRVHVQATLRERFVPPPPVRVRVVDAVEQAPPLPVRAVAGVGAGFDDGEQAAGAALVAVAYGDGELLRHANVPAGGTARLLVGGARVVRGRVLGPDGAPAAGAVVWLGQTTAAGRREFAVDAEGQYEADVPSGDGVPFVVRAPGCATQARVLDVGDAVVVDARLAAGCTLAVHVVATAEAMAHARVFALPPAEVGSDLAQWPFWLQALDGGAGFDGAAARLDGLPQGAEVDVVVAHPLAPRMAPQAVRCKGANPRVVVTLPPFAAQRLVGRVVDDQGAPLAFADVVLGGGATGRPPAPRLAPGAAVWRGVFAMTTDADGAFVVGMPDGDEPSFAVRAPGHAGRTLPIAAARAGGDVALPAWRGGDAALRVAPPQPAVPWTATADLAGGVRAAVAAGEAWQVSLPSAGRYDVVVATTMPGKEPARRELPGVDVTGIVDVASSAR
jgi:hypothetical protein